MQNQLLRKQQITPEILSEVKRLHFHTKRLADQGITGQYRSAFRGQGIEFEEVREYYPGMDIRSIDWKVTARSRMPYIKVFREERELTVMIAVDVSASTLTGTRGQLRTDLVAKTGAVLTLLAQKNNDKVGLVTFSDKIETYIPPRKARSSVWRIIYEVLDPQRHRPQTNLAGCFAFLSRNLKRRAVVFVISDFHDENFAAALAVLSKRHEVTAIAVSDPADLILPKAGLVTLRNPETGEEQLVDSSDPQVSAAYLSHAKEQREAQRRLFLNLGVNVIELSTDAPFMPVLRRFFSKRSSILLKHALAG